MIEKLKRENAQKVITSFWDNHKELSREERKKVVEKFLESLPLDDEHTAWLLRNFPVTHPATRKKSLARKCTLLEILGDFIMDVKRRDELKAEYPVWNPEAEFHREVVAKKTGKEISLDANEWVLDRIGTDGKDYRKPVRKIRDFIDTETENL